MSPKNAFSLATSGIVVENSDWALAKYVNGTGAVASGIALPMYTNIYIDILMHSSPLHRLEKWLR